MILKVAKIDQAPNPMGYIDYSYANTSWGTKGDMIRALKKRSTSIKKMELVKQFVHKT